MDAETPANQHLAVTVAHLQNEIRWMKRMAIAAALVVLVAFALYRHQRYRSVSGQEFVLTDASGTTRARLALFPQGAGLELYAASGEKRVQLLGGGEEAKLNLYIPVTATDVSAAVNLFMNDQSTASLSANGSSAMLELHPPAEKTTATLALRHRGAWLTFAGDADDSPKATLGIDAGNSCVVLDGAVFPARNGVVPPAKGALCMHSPGLPALELHDRAGKNMQLAPR